MIAFQPAGLDIKSAPKIFYLEMLMLSPPAGSAFRCRDLLDQKVVQVIRCYNIG